MNRALIIAVVLSVAFHLLASLLVPDFWQRTLTLSVEAAQRVSVRLVNSPKVEVSKAPEPALKKDNKIITKQAESELKISPPLPVIESPKQPEPPKPRPAPAKPPPKIQKPAEPPVSKPPEPMVAAKVEAESSVDSQAEEEAQGASSEYRLMESPRFAGRQTPPAYPYRARKMGHEGTVMLEIRLNREGRIDSLEVLESSGHASLDRAALKAVSGWQFLPLLEQGRGIPSRVRIPVRFKLS
ncbi:energy transducer TonB [Parendozoicomonas haliclonae]|uniref:Protein TonB n=1 Tax=Parendozoicomonas haliclonae TaxID=1960125 RepID=A0A1X7AFV6_9GAMM|nr:energy transducer TonB [Parendozoicomonas haliclonae]SMA38646.1 transport protein TonB [Parendozoicomonas haliclonae]